MIFLEVFPDFELHIVFYVSAIIKQKPNKFFKMNKNCLILEKFSNPNSALEAYDFLA